MATEITNGQHIGGSHDLMDKKNVAFKTLPEGTQVTWESSDENIAQVHPDPASPQIVDITTETDAVGPVTITSKMTLGSGATFPDGTTESTQTVDLVVTNSAPGTSKLTLGTPVDE